MIPVSEAWQLYEPVGFGVSRYELEIPESEELLYLFSRELNKFIDSELSARERPILARLSKFPEDKRLINSLGVLYAQFGRWEDAKTALSEAMPELMAAVNMGHLEYIEGEYEAAGEYYRQVLEKNPVHPAAVLGMIQTARALNDSETARDYLSQLSEISPDLAMKYSDRQDGTTRASSQMDYDTMILWEE